MTDQTIPHGVLARYGASARSMQIAVRGYAGLGPKPIG
jgi:hypothetical protein